MGAVTEHPIVFHNSSLNFETKLDMTYPIGLSFYKDATIKDFNHLCEIGDGSKLLVLVVHAHGRRKLVVAACEAEDLMTPRVLY